MSEKIRAHEKRPEEERCAFCHDALASGAVGTTARAECEKCGTPHHLGCFVENAGCAILGCGCTKTRSVAMVSPDADPRDVLHELVASVDRPIPPHVLRAQHRRMALAGPASPPSRRSWSAWACSRTSTRRSSRTSGSPWRSRSSAGSSSWA